MSESLFFRVLDVDVDDKGDALRAQIVRMNGDQSSTPPSSLVETGESFGADPQAFSAIPQAPFAYWVSSNVRRKFTELPQLADTGRVAKAGLCTGRNFQFIRAWWEVPISRVLTASPCEEHIDSKSFQSWCRHQTEVGQRWVLFLKGGEYSPYHSDPHLVVNWGNRGGEINRGADEGWLPGARAQNTQYYFLPGLTWTLRTQKALSFRAMPGGCISGHKGPAVFSDDPALTDLVALLGITNSLPFELLVELQMAFGSYEVGVINRTPVPPLDDEDARERLVSLAREAHDLQRYADRSNEITHVFGVPDLVRYCTEPSLTKAYDSLRMELEAEARRLRATQEEINNVAFEFYDLDAADRALARAGVAEPVVAASYAYQTNVEDQVQDLLMWCVGVVFGRWDVRKALDPSRLPPLGEPFDPLPRCAPGVLVGDDGLPLPRNDLPDDYPLPMAWDGILVDDADHPSDIVGRVQGVLDLLWGDRAGAIEREICEIIGVDRLRDYFRDYRNGFFAFHARRYSKSRRKAPIYWLLQSEERHYAVWLYYHRLDTSMLYAAGRGYADAKVELEQGRLETLQQGADALEGSPRRRRYREIERQKGVVQDVRAFRNKLDEIALLDLAFDLNDGVLLNIAPLRELVPWKYADRTWKRFHEGRYGWSSMAKELSEAGLVELTSKA